MKKRNLLLLVCILLAVVLVTVSCGKKNNDDIGHQHTFDMNSWTSDATGHWHAATCDDAADAKLQFAAHADSNRDGKCDVCKYVVCTHTYNTSAWESDETNHWHAATCGCSVVSDAAAHSDENKNGVCDVCDYVTCTHTFADEYENDENGHWLAYTCGCELEPTVSEHKDEDKNGNCDVCDYVLCAHNPEADWSYDFDSHWHESDCECEVQLDKGSHSYVDGSETCSVCGYVCTHELENEWSYDENGHWHNVKCEHEIEPTLEVHLDDDFDGKCDVCSYEDPSHEHTWAIAYNKHQHYTYSSCEHIIVKNFVNHVDDDNDGECDTCSAPTTDLAEIIDSITSDEAAAKVNGGVVYTTQPEVLNFTYSEGALSTTQLFYFSFSEEAPFSLVTTKAITSNEITLSDLAGEWNGEFEQYGATYPFVITINEDGTGSVVYSEVNEYWSTEFAYEIQSVEIDGTNVSMSVIQPSASYEFFKSFTKITSDGSNFYLSTYLKDGIPSIFKISEDDGEISNLSSYADINELKGPSIGVMYNYVNEYGVESLIYALYELTSSEDEVIFNFVENYDEESGLLTFSFARLNVSEWAGDSIQIFTATLTVENGAIASAEVISEEYMSGNYFADVENGVVILYENAVIDFSTIVTVNQTLGERKDEANPFPAENVLILDLKIFNQATGEEIKDGDVIEIGVGQENALYITLPEADVEKASANEIYLTALDSLGFQTYEINASHWDYPYTVYSYNKAGDYTIEVSSTAGGTVSFTVRFTHKAPTSLAGAVVVDGYKEEASEVTTYPNLGVTVSAIAPSSAESTMTNATVTAGDPDAVALTQDGDNWTVTVSEVGTYTITLTSTMDENVFTTVTVVVEEAPTAAELLNGTWKFLEGYGEEISVTFTPESEGAVNGTVVIAFDNNAYFDEVAFNETATYAYADGVITLTHVEGDGLELVAGLEITEDYKLNLIVYTYPEWPQNFYLDKVENTQGGTDVPGGEGDGEGITLEGLAGTWTGSESGGIMALTATLTIGADGTGSGSYNDGFDRPFTIEGVTIDGNIVVVAYNSGRVTQYLDFTYENGTLTSTYGFYTGTLTLTKGDVNDEGGDEGISLEALEGTWTGSESGGIMELTATLTIAADGTGSGSYNDGIDRPFTIEGVTIDGNMVVVAYNNGRVTQYLEFTYENGTLTSTYGFYAGTLTLTKA